MSIVAAVSARLADFALPAWAPWAAGALAMTALASGSYGLGRVQEARIGAKTLADYQGKQVAQTVRIVERQAAVKVVVETKYVDRIKKIYVQGERIETLVPQYITPGDTARFGVNAGFVRVVDAAWTGDPVGSPGDPDRKPAAVSLADVAGAEAGNATSCLAWREQAYGWRDFYARQQVAVNGRAGDWAHAQEP